MPRIVPAEAMRRVSAVSSADGSGDTVKRVKAWILDEFRKAATAA